MSNTIGFDAQLDREGFLDGWRMNAYYQHGNNEQNFDTDNGIRVDRIPLAFDAVSGPNGQPACYAALVNPAVFGDCVPMNIFGGLQNLTPAAWDYIVDDYKVAFQDTSQDFVEFVMTGDAWDGWGAGAISGCLRRLVSLRGARPDHAGSDGRIPGHAERRAARDPRSHHPGRPRLDRGVHAGRATPAAASATCRRVSAATPTRAPITFSSLRAISGGYDVRDVFGELNIPIASDAGWANQFDVSTAVRWADYSGSGEIWAGKVGMNWQVSDAVRLRVTQSRDVRAATLRERFDQTRGGVTVNDPLKGGASISTASFSGGNPNVNPEEADTTTAGIVFQPTGLDGLSVSFDWYQIDINGAIAQLASQAVVNGCVPTDQSLCEYVIRDPVTSDIVRVDNLFINLQRQVIEGADLELTYAFGNFDSAHVRHAAHGELRSEPRRGRSTIAPATSAAPTPDCPTPRSRRT